MKPWPWLLVFKRMADERERHNQEAISILKEMVLNKEEEISALEHELETCRHMFFALEGGCRIAEDADYPRYLRLEADSEGYDTCASRFNNGFSRLRTSEDNTNSRHTWRSSKKNFTGLISDDIRSNLASCFNRTDEHEEGDKMEWNENTRLMCQWLVFNWMSWNECMDIYL